MNPEPTNPEPTNAEPTNAEPNLNTNPAPCTEKCERQAL